MLQVLFQHISENRWMQNEGCLLVESSEMVGDCRAGIGHSWGVLHRDRVLPLCVIPCPPPFSPTVLCSSRTTPRGQFLLAPALVLHGCVCVCVCVCVCSVMQSRPAPSSPMDCSPSGSSIHGIIPARILEWVAGSSSRESSWTRDRTCASCVPALADWFFTTAPPGKPQGVAPCLAHVILMSLFPWSVTVSLPVSASNPFWLRLRSLLLFP